MIMIEDGAVYIALLENRQHVGYILPNGKFMPTVDMPGLGNEVAAFRWRALKYGPFFFQDRELSK